MWFCTARIGLLPVLQRVSSNFSVLIDLIIHSSSLNREQKAFIWYELLLIVAFLAYQIFWNNLLKSLKLTITPYKDDSSLLSLI